MNKEELLGKIIGIIYRIYSSTFRYHVCHEDKQDIKTLSRLKDYRQHSGESLIVATWHQDELAVIPFFTSGDATIMVSKSKDGTILAGALSIFGYNTVRGSSTRHGVGAFMGALKVIKEGRTIAFACDGPKGPVFVAKEGIIKISNSTKSLIVPIRANPHHAYVFKKSWSKSRLPLPFSRIDLIIGKPGYYTANSLSEKLNSYFIQ